MALIPRARQRATVAVVWLEEVCVEMHLIKVLSNRFSVQTVPKETSSRSGTTCIS